MNMCVRVFESLYFFRFLLSQSVVWNYIQKMRKLQYNYVTLTLFLTLNAKTYASKTHSSIFAVFYLPIKTSFRMLWTFVNYLKNASLKRKQNNNFRNTLQSVMNDFFFFLLFVFIRLYTSWFKYRQSKRREKYIYIYE